MSLVSIYIPTRNRAEMVVEAIGSALAQSHRDIEVLVVDDASGDRTPEILTALQSRDERLRVLSLPTQVGPSAARNLAISAARGDFVTGLDDDDLILSDRIETLLAAYHSGLAFVCSAFSLRSATARERTLNNRGSLITLTDLLFFNAVGNQALVPREYLLSVGGFDEAMSGFEDYDLWLRLALRYGPGLRIPQSTYVKRDHRQGDQLTYAPSFLAGARKFREKHLDLFDERQLRSQLMIEKIILGESIGVLALARAAGYPSAELFFRYWSSRTLRRLSRSITGS